MTRLGASGRRWFWLRDGLIPAGQAASETIPLYALVVLMGAIGQQGLALGYLRLAGIVAVSAWLTRLTDLLPRRWYLGRIVLVLLTAFGLVVWVHLALAPHAAWDPLTMLTVVSQPWRADPGLNGQMLFVAWFLAICLWSRGLWIGMETANAAIEARWFIGGMAVLLLLVAVVTVGTTEQVNAIAHALRLLILGYFSIGLLVLALIHASTLRGTGGPAPGASLPWVVAVAVPIAAIPMVGLLLTVGAAPAVRLVMQASVIVANFAWHVMLWIGYWLLLFLMWLSSLFPAGHGGVSRGRAGPSRPPPPIATPQLPDYLSVSAFDATIVVVVLVFGLLLALLAYLLTRQRASVDTPVPEDERSSVWSWGLFLSQLQALWDLLLKSRRAGLTHEQSAATHLAAGFGHDDEHDVRALYRRFLRHAAAIRHPRPVNATPVEFARDLTRSDPACSRDIGLVTDVYDRTRYGQKSVGPAAVAAMRESVRRWESRGEPRDPDVAAGKYGQ